MIKTYYSLTKPGIVYGNALTLLGGFFLASRTQLLWPLLLATLIGSSLVIASGCVFNNYLDRDLDEKMGRTRKRALVTGAVPVRQALIFATILGLLGMLVLARYTNVLTVLIGLVGFIFYVLIYDFTKRRSDYGTLVGSISGAVPPLVGYVAVKNQVDAGAVILFLAVALWQMPHFYAIALYRLKDYAAAHIPVLPLTKGVRATRLQTMLYIVASTITACLLTVYGYTGYTYLAFMILLGDYWMWLGYRQWHEDDARWGQRLFRFSLIVITVFSVLIALGAVLP